MIRPRRHFLPVLFTLLAASAVLGDGGRDHRALQPLPIRLGTSGSVVGDLRSTTGTGRDCFAATLGSAIYCNGVLHILSNNHVLAQSNDGITPPGTDVLQPGARDTMCQEAGTVVADFVGDVVPDGVNNVDAALAAARPGAVDPQGAILDIGAPCAEPAPAFIGMPVAKSGRTTGLTFGTVFALNVTVNFFKPDGSTVTLTNQIAISPGDPQFVKAGDSGSLVVTDDADHRPVGLLHAAGRNSTFANPAADVVNAFAGYCAPGGLSFAGRVCGPAAATLALRQDAMEWAAARQVQERHTGWLMRLPSVVAVGLAHASDSDGTPALVVFLEGPRVPAGLPRTLDGVPVRAVETGPIRRL